MSDTIEIEDPKDIDTLEAVEAILEQYQTWKLKLEHEPLVRVTSAPSAAKIQSNSQNSLVENIALDRVWMDDAVKAIEAVIPTLRDEEATYFKLRYVRNLRVDEIMFLDEFANKSRRTVERIRYRVLRKFSKILVDIQ